MESRRYPPKSQQKRKPNGSAQPGQTKFDKWLESEPGNREFLFKVNPLTPGLGAFALVGTPIQVDRYMVMIDFEEGDVLWVAKDNIIACR